MGKSTVPTWLYAIGVAGTWAIAALAIWGERIRSVLFRANLRLIVLDSTGELTTQNVPQGFNQPRAIVEARYYHLRLTNQTRFPAAHEVQVFITALDILGPGGQPQRVFTGALPLTWRHGQLHPILRTIGSTTEAEADLFFVRPDGLQITALSVPNNFPATYAGSTHIWITAVARGLDGESAPLRLKIDWDGQWDRGEAEMARHLVVTTI